MVNQTNRSWCVCVCVCVCACVRACVCVCVCVSLCIHTLFQLIILSVLTWTVTDIHWYDAKGLCVLCKCIASLGGHEHDLNMKLAPSVCGTQDAMAQWQDVPKRHPHTHTNRVKWAIHRCLSDFGFLNWITSNLTQTLNMMFWGPRGEDKAMNETSVNVH